MARARVVDPASKPLHKAINSPGPYLRGMLVFLVLVGFLVAIIYPQLVSAFWTNPLLNGLIIGVLVVGILRVFGLVIRLYPEIRWVNAFRISDPGLSMSLKPTLLAPMATMLRDRRGYTSLSTTSMRSIMDSIGGRLDEARDTGRYLVGLLVFLGLLGTFWGLLETIQSVGKVISSLDSKQSDTTLVFEELKTGLSAPLRGMGTAFSASLLGLAGSLILGFLDLQANHAHNRFYNELEEWLSGITELTPGGAAGVDGVNPQLVAVMADMRQVLAELSQRMAAAPPGSADGADGAGMVKELAVGIDALVRQMRAEQKVVREWVDEQATRQTEVAATIKDIAQSIQQRRK